ncbi:hypothetical protein H3019_gp09 [Bacillus phage Karezi]|uniref:Uncharacterized protein n=1 Tax=Bacillus phage Karezi TaxID=2591398 RepID=A0A514AAQ8_9CAUD|nr:hypothetical protein H3019_gp09 [Bacillus phage Karezi]QDH50360.1 hypothetical protein KAREZI_9 [Bacillus phage Karezi]
MELLIVCVSIFSIVMTLTISVLCALWMSYTFLNWKDGREGKNDE